MNLFEYITIAFSFVLSMGVARLVSGLPSILDERRYNLHVSLTFLTLLSAPLLFWGAWGFHNVEWTLPAFYLLLSTAAFYLMAAVFIVPEQKESVEDWKTYYFEYRQGIFLSILAMVFSLNLCRVLLGDHDILGPRSIPPALLMVALFCMAISRNEIVHRIIGLMVLIVFSVIVYLNRSTETLP